MILRAEVMIISDSSKAIFSQETFQFCCLWESEEYNLETLIAKPYRFQTPWHLKVGGLLTPIIRPSILEFISLWRLERTISEKE